MKSLKRKRFLSGTQRHQKSCLPAVGAEGGLFKVDRHELVPVDLVDTPPKSSSPLRISKPASLLKFRNCLSLAHSVFCCLLDNNRKHAETEIRVALIVCVSILTS